MRRLFTVRNTAAISVALALALWRFGATVADPDLWGHVRFGIDKIDAGAYLGVDAYSYLTAGSTWFNHEWLAEVIMGAVYLVFGGAGLVWLKAFLAGLLVVILHGWLLEERVEPLRSIFVMALMVILLTPTLGTLRPQVFTTLLMTALLLAIVRYQRQPGNRVIWLMPVLFVVWVNLHGGALSGVAVLWVWALTYAVFERDHPTRFHPILWSLASTLALLANPNGAKHVLFLLKTTTVSRPEIVEWQPIDLTSFVGAVYAVVAVLVLLMLIRRRSDAVWPICLPLVGLALAPLLASRHLQLFVPAVVILGTPYLLPLLNLGTRNELEPVGWSSRSAIPAALIVLAGGVFSIARVAGAAGCLSIDATQFEFPVRGVAALAATSVTGNAVVPFNWGEYVIWHLGPEVQVSGDGRRETVYSDVAYQANLDFADGVGDWDRILGMAPTDLVIQRTGTPGDVLMDGKSDWALVYRDPVTSIFQPAGRTVQLTGASDVPADGDGVCFPG
ncbi:MAG: hypothetical protein WBZ40_02355 [Acidimicrobiia bacterium]